MESWKIFEKLNNSGLFSREQLSRLDDLINVRIDEALEQHLHDCKHIENTD